MDRTSCFFERISNSTVGVVLLIIGVLLTVISLVALPVIGLVVAIPVLALGFVFLFSRQSRACALISERAKKALSV
jgi:membrane-bound ClpP family serine protease